ncbi:MAG: hypothetical protein HCA25_23605 [Dolichospermum sp. DET50]|nr:hypothetical protein [Dolichospermum sp. DET66]MBS3035153.1 hypothetical protein [Dolichospermum sp. DET67]MBS3040353.1 hypothetical protein [Dolichospermum sp. DET50]QSX67507.1 MAG: hypothetical protein EZY12_22880 [Dolichospermum sp. DET69]
MTKKKPNKEELLKAIEQLEKNPHDRINFLTDIGVIGVGAVGAGAAAFAFGGTTASILFGLVTLPVAAPVAVVAGAAVLGGAALFGAKRFLVDGTSQQGKREEMLRQWKDKLREIETEEKKSTISHKDKTDFYSFLKEPLKLDLITAEDAQNLMKLVEAGELAMSDAYKLVIDILSEARGLPPSKS